MRNIKKCLKKKKGLPTWIQNVDLGQKRTFDIQWIFILVLVIVLSIVFFIGIYFYQSAVDDYQVFQRVEQFLIKN